MKRNLNKVVMATFAMITSIVVLMLAAYAWYTLSTNPEIKGLNFSVSGEQAILISKDNIDYNLSTNLTNDLKDYKSLVPVSTVDGDSWFVCKYDAMGNVLQDQVKDGATVVGTQFEHMTFPAGGNDVPSGIVTDNSGNGVKENYYIWKDIFLKTTEKSVDVYLTVPNNSAGYVQDDTEQYHYGSYVMSYSVSGDEENPQIALLDGGSETCVRVGMKVLGEVAEGSADATPQLNKTSGDSDGGLFIYEPNADKRSSLDKSSNDYRTDEYISGFKAKDYYTVGEETGTSNLTYAQVAAGEYYLPTYPVAPRDATIGGETVTDGKVSVFPADHLIVQKKSSWKQNASYLPDKGFNSTMIGHMGKFLALGTVQQIYNKDTLAGGNTDYQAQSLRLDPENNPSVAQSDRSGVKLTTLRKDTPKKVRLYFWVEGQDVDCWNDISSTNFLVNLEFSGQTN